MCALFCLINDQEYIFPQKSLLSTKFFSFKMKLFTVANLIRSSRMKVSVTKGLENPCNLLYSMCTFLHENWDLLITKRAQQRLSQADDAIIENRCSSGNVFFACMKTTKNDIINSANNNIFVKESTLRCSFSCFD